MSVTPSPPSTEPSPAQAQAAPAVVRSGWTAGRIVALVIGCLVGLFSLGLLAGGGWATWMTNTQRDSSGYLTADAHILDTSGYAVTSKGVAELAKGPYDAWLGTVRVRVTPTDPADRIFIGVGATSAVTRYLAGVDRIVVTNWFPYRTDKIVGAGGGPATPPTAMTLWTNHVSGTGTQTLKWKPSSDTKWS